MKLPELKSLMKENKLKGSSYMNKPEIIAVLLDKGIINEFTRFIRNNPKNVEIRDLETGEIATYSSLYKASRATGWSTKFITGNNGKVGKNRYKIKIQ